MARISEKEELAYLAGLVDGEGGIGIAANSRGRKATFVRLIVTGTDKQLGAWLYERFGGDINWKRRAKNWWKPEFTWRLSHSNAVSLIEKIDPYLQIKWPQSFLAQAHECIKKMAREDGRLVSLGYRRGCTFDADTADCLGFIRQAVKMFNARGANAPDPWSFVDSARR